MQPEPMTEVVLKSYPEFRAFHMGVEEGVEGVQDIQMLRSIVRHNIGGPKGFYTYQWYGLFRPTTEDLDALNNGGLLEVGQVGMRLQPFSLQAMRMA